MNRPDDGSRRADDDAVWRDIVAGYGDRPEFPDPVANTEPDPIAAEPEVPQELRETPWEDEGHFIPPVPPPVPRPRGIRAVAWFGLFGIPTLMLLLLLVHYTPPSPIGLLMVAWFVGGFGYLVATMNARSDTDGGWDNGAVL